MPEIAGWRRERLPALPREGFLTLAPDWQCEHLSPSTSRFDRTKKLPLYARAHIPYLWLLDPLNETLETYRLDGDNWVLLATHGGGGLHLLAVGLDNACNRQSENGCLLGVS